ncbi:glycoside hydrolase 43 family protein [Polaribacter reichenbachii]|uniref:Beta-xylosidase C-terminal Concanavalin A-like domain-containing protein n=1 Tax=Polaribacter reichenbachii TaxID=996801 RepID=A0A1B8TNU3_9FLAO|nr:glycoside hydrolase family 43 protein [Polaribacter reichenbachii]APZ46655.1 glycoside hydrolase 43 family protein [Polaribacter reichenbachii]AUC17298.1 glycoside hydrolase 43 family protein [Polaribacter reichenbachii]OBY61254.1 hypothetical protein LPB301_17465 [Polaribacter reichenbachii]
MLKKTIFIAFSLCSILFGCKKLNEKMQPVVLNNNVAFQWFNYNGKDEIFSKEIDTMREFHNPILSGFYPDPSICSANGKFYLITSSFSYFPGIPIFESSDLVNWKQIGHVINRKEQADFKEAGVSKGMFAPTIRYNNGTFYVICTNVTSGGNFIVTSKDPAGPWSDPIFIEGVNGIDPDIFFDDNGKVYITHNGPPPNNITLHDGHRAIYMFEYDIENFKIIGESKLIVNGGTDLSQKPVWIEAPHIIKKNNYYYLICAQGGTGFNHTEVVFRSKDVFGPYEGYKNNPILTQKHLDPNRKNNITTTGHADFVELPNGDWWSVFLGCRPYEGDLYNTGRETFLLPVKWENDWPYFVDGKQPILPTHKRPNLEFSKNYKKPTNGNFNWKDNFNDSSLSLEWNFIRTPEKQWHQLENGYLKIPLRDLNIKEQKNFSFIGRRQQHLKFDAATKVHFNFKTTNQTAGLVAFQNESHYLYLGVKKNSNETIDVFVEKAHSKTKDKTPQFIDKKTLNINSLDEITLKIEGNNRYYSFYYQLNNNNNWKPIALNIDAKLLSTKEAGGFVGTYLAMYASNNHFKKIVPKTEKN